MQPFHLYPAESTVNELETDIAIVLPKQSKIQMTKKETMTTQALSLRKTWGVNVGWQIEALSNTVAKLLITLFQ